MQILHWPEVVTYLAIDVDDTIYAKSADYVSHQRDVELQAIASAFGISKSLAQIKLAEQAAILEGQLNRKPSAAEVVRSLGFTQEWLVGVRIAGWDPESFLTPRPGLPDLMERLTKQYKVAFASTSPREIVNKVFRAIGLSEAVGEALVIGGGDVRPKPAPDIYVKVTESFGLPAEQGLSIGDRLDFDALPARSIGMGAVVVSDVEEFEVVAKRLLGGA